MKSPSDVVTAFFRAWGPARSDVLGALKDYMTADAVWENVGMSTTRGPDEASVIMEKFFDAGGFEAFHVDVLHIAVAGDTVLTERIDYAVRADGTRSEKGIRVAGVFEVTNGKIAAWRDYFDTAPFMRKAK